MTASDAPNQRIQRHPHPGFFLALEGPDGGGKSTQAARLVGWLRDQGFDVVACRDPGSTALGERLRGVLLDRDQLHPSPRAEMLLFMASRAQLVEEVVKPALAAGRVVVSDRFLLSNIVYQGIAGGLPIDEIARVGPIATGGVLPDLTLVLDISHKEATARVGAARDRMEDRPESFHRRVREGYLDAVQLGLESPDGCPYFPSPLVLVQAHDDADAVFERIREEVGNVLAIGPRS